MERTSLMIEYKKFNTFFMDFIKNINRGYLFMKMKHKYPIDTDLDFKVIVAGFDSEIKFQGKVVYHGINEKGKDGIGIFLTIDDKTKKIIKDKIKDITIKRYAHWSEDMLLLLGD